MKRIIQLLLGLFLVALIASSVSWKPARTAEIASPIYGVAIPADYRSWKVVGVSQETGKLNELRIIFGNDLAIKAFERGTLPFPDGATIVKVGWQRQASDRDNAALGVHQAYVPGPRSKIADVQMMVKDSRRYSTSGGWGFGKFEAGMPQSEALHQTCFACHLGYATRAQDYVFTHYAH
jgi:hypothetical protein